MSLLLDALKRAEQEKLARQGQAAAAENGNADAPVSPRRSLELESVDAPPSDKAAPAAGAAAPGPDRQGARAVFAAKQPAPAARAVKKSRAPIFIVVGIAALALLGGGGYVWYEINKPPGMIARAPMAPGGAPRPVTPAPPAPAAPAADGKAPAADARAEAAREGESVPPVSPIKPAGLDAKSKPQPKAAEQLVMSLLKDSPRAARSAPPLKLTRTIETPRVAPEVARGYEALRTGDVATALKAYEAAVAADATSLDAHLGLATAGARAGDRALATRHYRRALELDPKNPSAVAGLAALADFSRPDVLEAQLRADLTRYPQSAPLHYTLGNLYAAQKRWNEAQAAFFEAYRLDPDSPDIAYNLAVSLDHLGQSRPAADFYQRALAAARQQGVQFDKGQVSRRLAELKP